MTIPEPIKGTPAVDKRGIMSGAFHSMLLAAVRLLNSLDTTVNGLSEDADGLEAGATALTARVATLEGYAEGKQRTLWIPAAGLGNANANPATAAVNASGFGILEFPDAADSYAEANIRVPEDMDLSKNAYIKIGWSVPNTSEQMTWGFGYIITGENSDTEATPETGQVVVLSSPVADGLKIDQLVGIAGGTITSEDFCIHGYLFRDVSEDSYGAAVDLHGIALCYTSKAGW